MSMDRMTDCETELVLKAVKDRSKIIADRIEMLQALLEEDPSVEEHCELLVLLQKEKLELEEIRTKLLQKR